MICVGTLIHYTAMMSVLDREAGRLEEAESKNQHIHVLERVCTENQRAMLDQARVQNQRMVKLEREARDKDRRIVALEHRVETKERRMSTLEHEAEAKDQRIAFLLEKGRDVISSLRAATMREAADHTLRWSEQKSAHRMAAPERMVDEETRGFAPPVAWADALALESFERNGVSDVTGRQGASGAQ